MVPVAMIVAVAENGVIGKDNDLPWHIPEDLKWFKNKTMGKPIIMGRKTFDSFEGLLPGRPHIVMSGNPDFSYPDVQVARSIQSALEIGQSLAQRDNADELMVVGGDTIYRQAMPFADRIYRTRIALNPEGDAYFPELDSDWTLVLQEKKSANGVNFSFQTLEKRV